MSIASRISSMEEHVTNAYNGLQGLGADLTNVNKNIENISMVLDDIYDSMPQVSGEGTSLTLDDTRVGKIKSTLKGNTSQITYTGKNLIDSQWETRTQNGVTITNNGDGTYTLNGTSTASSAFSLQSITGQESSHPLITNIKNNVGKYLTISTGYSSNQGCYLQLNLSNQGGGSGQYGFVTSVYTYSNTLITSNESDIAYINFFIGIMGGASFNNLKIYPMITIQSSQITPAPTPSNFEPYVGGTASPNPSYPQPVNVVSGDNEIIIANEDNTDSNTYNIDLPEDMELCKIGNYQDYFYKDNGSWYLHKEIGKIVLDGSETWVKHGSIASWFYYDGIRDGYVLDNTQIFIKTNYYTPKAYQGVPNLVNGECSYGSSDNGITHRFVIKNTDYTQTNDFKTWLSTHNTIVYYVLATPTNTLIEDTTLIEQLEEIKSANSYEGQTNISQENNDLPFIISASALKEWSV